MEPLDHPDLQRLDRSLQQQIDDILAAEQHAARVAAERRMSLRDRLVRAEDRGDVVSVRTTIGTFTGDVVSVGMDHVVVGSDEPVAVGFEHIVALVGGLR